MKSTKRNTFTLDTALIKLQTVLEERDDDYGSSNDSLMIWLICAMLF
jgi:hypothetical protein